VQTQDNYDLQILNHIEENPETTQADLATQLGVAVGSVNWYIKRLVNKGYIKVTKMQRRRLKYLLTPSGISEKTRLTGKFLQASLKWYRVTRTDTRRLLDEIEQAGYNAVCIEGDGDLAEIIYLTCLEAGVNVQPEPDRSLPVFRIENFKTVVDWPGEAEVNQ
jgi:DNA-binding Lrp family transcriptional regulator